MDADGCGVEAVKVGCPEEVMVSVGRPFSDRSPPQSPRLSGRP